MKSLVVLALLALPPYEPPPLAVVDTPAVADQPAVRLDTPTTQVAIPTFNDASTNGRCVGAEPLLTRYSPGWNVERMSRIMYRESRCQPDAYNRGGQAAGLLQVTPINYRYLSNQLGEPVTARRLFDPEFNIRAAAELFEYDGYGPWKL